MPIHIPIITYENVLFYCADKHVNMDVGQAWIFDSWKYHSVHNGGKTLRVHLVIDICGSSQFGKLVENSYTSYTKNISIEFKTNFLEVELQSQVAIHTKQFNAPVVMIPGLMV